MKKLELCDCGLCKEGNRMSYAPHYKALRVRAWAKELSQYVLCYSVGKTGELFCNDPLRKKSLAICKNCKVRKELLELAKE